MLQSIIWLQEGINVGNYNYNIEKIWTKNLDSALLKQCVNFQIIKVMTNLNINLNYYQI